ncbi:MAG: S24 family peptidase [Dialister invisus]|uniref:S24 family peptidase n=1 Tax=Dialister invisus TaxID=218538 RepID=UPI00399B09B6
MCYADLSQQESAPNVPAGWYYEIPEGISAGALEDLDALYELPRISIPDSLMGRYAHNSKVVFIHINGQSMDKIIADGSVVAVMTGIEREQLRDGDLVVVSNGHGYTVKQFLTIHQIKELSFAQHPITQYSRI